RRVIRALEMAEHSDVKKSHEAQHQGERALYNHLIIGLNMDREKLYGRINLRVDRMLEQGLIEEVRGLYDRGIRDVQSIRAIGYKELYDYFDGRETFEQAIENLKQNSRRYAKRQLTYFRNKMAITWYDSFSAKEQLFKDIFQ
ncbi:MAG TPA: tRNA (adenosine(37)-N6)-dimethylallyltransferase MiaA, partial [Candidatus Kurthia intestinigallinarum]|nr:tRNA (adenosine(37)-N6)-dimethylallyltransferase MiaA [Candidatus Kurthia intestinigallinarum]